MSLSLKYRDLAQQINALTKAQQHIELEYLRACKSDTLEKLSKTLGLYGYSNYSQFIENCREHLTLYPIATTFRRTSKYEHIVRHDAILYEWDGQLISYCRASENSDGYYDGCQYYNGFNTDGVIEKDVSFYWKTHLHISSDNIEQAIKLKSTNFTERCKNVDPKFHLIIAAFCCIDEDIIPDEYVALEDLLYPSE